MARSKTTGPTDRELEILQVLWDRGASTAREIHHVLDQQSKTAYNSVLTMLRIMLKKNLVSRDEAPKSHVYEAKYAKADMETKLVKSFMDNVFGGSAMRLVTRALSVKPASQKEKDTIRQILEGKDYEEP